MEFHLLKHRVYKIFGEMHFFETEYGIKVYNKPSTFEPDIYLFDKVVELQPEEIYLGFDGLNDEYTLCEKKVIDSPHVDLIRTIKSGNSIYSSEYIQRERLGALDGRYSLTISDNVLNDRVRQCKICEQMVRENRYQDVYVYMLNDKYYVLDGKHRIAMCYFLNKRVRCHVLGLKELCDDIYTQRLYEELNKNSDKYSRNIAHLKPIIEKVDEASPKVLIVNRNRTDNLGDQAIAYSMSKIFTSVGASVEMGEFCNSQGDRNIYLNKNITDNMVDDDSKSRGLKDRIKRFAYNNTYIKNIIWLFRNQNLFLPLKSQKYDYIIIGGGEIIQSNSEFPLAFYWWIKKIKKYQSEAKVGLFAVGVTEEYSKRDLLYIKRGIEELDFIFVRDLSSQENLRAVFGKDSVVIPDSVFINMGDPVFTIHNNDAKNVLYGITPFNRIKRYGILAKTQSDYFENIIADLKEIEQGSPKQKILLYYTTFEDKIECFRFNEYCLSKTGKQYGIAEINSLSDLIHEYANTKTVYSPRMHGCIIANIVGNIDVHPIIISPKMNSFYNMYYINNKREILNVDLLSAASKLLTSEAV